MLVNVIVPRPWWNNLTYELDYDFIPENGTRVFVPLGKSKCVGFINGISNNSNEKNLDFKNFEIKKIIEVLDNGKKIIPYDLWDLALWAGRVYMCGAGTALKMIFPENFLKGEEVPDININKNSSERKVFKERNFFSPVDEERYDFYIEELKKNKNKKILILFSLQEAAKNFYLNLPEELKEKNILLWPSTGGKKLWDSWKEIYSGNSKILIAPPGGVFAPFQPEEIIIEDEANPSYIFQRTPFASARSLAGRRALTLGAEFLTCGRMPSSKTFLRLKPEEDKNKYFIDKKFFIPVDINCSLKESEKGIEGEIKLTYSLIERTQKELEKGNNVLWIFDRLGNAGEVFCKDCGETIKCKICGGIMRSELNGEKLRCINCGKIQDLPLKCENCGSKFFSGKRPGLDSLFKTACKYFPEGKIFLYKNKNPESSSNFLILGTNAILSLCNKKTGLIAWLDLENELRRPEYDTRFNIFRLLWDSYWRGRNNFNNKNLNGNNNTSERTVIIQTGEKGLRFINFLIKGWENFWREELKLREELFLPPYGFMVEINCDSLKQKNKIISMLEEAGIFVMYSGEEDFLLLINIKSLEGVKISKILEPLFSISNLKFKSKFPSIIIKTE